MRAWPTGRVAPPQYIAHAFQPCYCEARFKASAPEVPQHVWHQTRDFRSMSVSRRAVQFRAKRLEASAPEVPQHVQRQTRTFRSFHSNTPSLLGKMSKSPSLGSMSNFDANVNVRGPSQN